MNNIKLGDKVKAIKMADDSFYKQVIGTVEYIRNGFVGIKATIVMDKWSDNFKEHPCEGCSTSAKIENVVKL